MYNFYVFLVFFRPFCTTFARRNTENIVSKVVQSHGLVLHTIRYSDSQLIVSIFTEAAGTVPFLVRAARGSKNGPKASVWQQLSQVDVAWEPRLRTNLQKPRELTLWKPWHSLPFDPAKTAMALFLGEFLYRALHNEQENVALFQYLTNALQWLDESEGGYANFHLVVLLHLTRFLGFTPSTDEWTEGCYFDMQAATFTPQQPSHPHFLAPAEAALLPKFLRMDLRSMRPVGLNGERRNRILQLITEFYRLHIPEFPELHSLEVLAEVFARA